VLVTTKKIFKLSGISKTHSEQGSVIFVIILTHPFVNTIDGDRVYIFGFSREASSARLLASKLNEHDLPKKITLHYRDVKNTGQKEVFFALQSRRRKQ